MFLRWSYQHIYRAKNINLYKIFEKILWVMLWLSNCIWFFFFVFCFFLFVFVCFVFDSLMHNFFAKDTYNLLVDLKVKLAIKSIPHMWWPFCVWWLGVKSSSSVCYYWFEVNMYCIHIQTILAHLKNVFLKCRTNEVKLAHVV